MLLAEISNTFNNKNIKITAENSTEKYNKNKKITTENSTEKYNKKSDLLLNFATLLITIKEKPSVLSTTTCS